MPAHESDQELISMAGKIDAEKVPDYHMELYKRAKKLSLAERKKFYHRVIAAANKNTANMTMEEFENHMEAIQKAIRARVAKMTRTQFDATGLRLDGKLPYTN
ncbi:hypothetical protein NHP190012_09270 [Helicobacter sp. NHP19-012]|uniref:Uncharacterized protein n=1 Tax=Helicobacter gastrofelis TaxID=2849642 RepID=A0ABM7SES2_9HELI|nr:MULTISPECIES: DUF1104 domain-containing protein [unclassified Helicobacter]BCZ19285.1 hypothetical protein NHP190012_09270 [Helicobacter sp. NHP19-012]GMB96062.1 hypothetical protein NHP22001_06510 [Helicobacter sp. NHP22-001]